MLTDLRMFPLGITICFVISALVLGFVSWGALTHFYPEVIKKRFISKVGWFTIVFLITFCIFCLFMYGIINEPMLH